MRFNIAPAKIETAVLEHYATAKLTPAEVGKAKAAIRMLAEQSAAAVEHVRASKQQLIRKLEAQQDRLLDLYDEEAISKAVFSRRQAKLEEELHSAQASLAETDLRLALDEAQLAKALDLVGDVQATYEAADDRTRRGLNQAFFRKLLVDAEAEEGQRQPRVFVSETELTEPYALLLAESLVQDTLAEADRFARQLLKPKKHPRFGCFERRATGWADARTIKTCHPCFDLRATSTGNARKFERLRAGVAPDQRPSRVALWLVHGEAVPTGNAAETRMADLVERPLLSDYRVNDTTSAHSSKFRKRRLERCGSRVGRASRFQRPCVEGARSVSGRQPRRSRAETRSRPDSGR
jgi:hypothetical protein